MIRFSDIPKYDLMSEAEQKSVIDLIRMINENSMLARREGLLALDNCLDKINEKEMFFANLLRLVVDGNDETVISSIALNLITTTQGSDYEKLKMQIAANGALEIQAGTNPMVTAEILLSMLGAETYFKLKNEFYI